MNNSTTKLEKEALMRQLEHHIDDVCESIIKTVTYIHENNHITQTNFVEMSHMGESLEFTLESCSHIKLFLTSIRTAETLLDKLIPADIQLE